MPDQKPRKELRSAKIAIRPKGGYRLTFRHENEQHITSQLLRADFEKMEFETMNTIYKINKLLTS